MQSLNSYAAGQPSQYEVTVGTPAARVTLFDAGVFYQDDWRLRPNFTLSYGSAMRGKTGSAIMLTSDRAFPSPGPLGGKQTGKDGDPWRLRLVL
jgi:hypothetical protein